MSAWANIGAAVVAAAMFMPAAQAQTMCAPRQSVVDGLSKYGELVILRGLAGSGLLEVWQSSFGGFTIVVTDPDNVSCLLAIGRSMHEVPPPSPPGDKL